MELWLERNGKGYDLHIGGNGGIEAPEDSSYLFYGYENVEKILLKKILTPVKYRICQECFMVVDVYRNWK